ncbi:hypothetical protein E1B28_011267 [Marasmius oreades]|uniref:Uncharacterized protein n=1 Tax=Marasmius oreades TaxID=181124 RepID=A0A9P7UQ11_9AGAR|nr:uncharacterized protein E1B28_011267 [Marasmius oreades]KAG7089600.1 hypothetical protein E1B28_011267 [Marasmius oreades]
MFVTIPMLAPVHPHIPVLYGESTPAGRTTSLAAPVTSRHTMTFPTDVYRLSFQRHDIGSSLLDSFYFPSAMCFYAHPRDTPTCDSDTRIMKVHVS